MTDRRIAVEQPPRTVRFSGAVPFTPGVHAEKAPARPQEAL